MKLRPAETHDRDAIIALIESVYSEYGERMCLEDADKDLLDVGKSYRNGQFMVLDDEGDIRGTVAVSPISDPPTTCCLKRLYLHPDDRGAGWAHHMVEWAREWARERGMKRMEFWSDVRFTRAHAFYEKLGFVRTGDVRTMADGWDPYDEFFFYADL